MTESIRDDAQPPWSKPPRRSSSGRPGACMTPSSVRWLKTTTLLIWNLLRVPIAESSQAGIGSNIIAPGCRAGERIMADPTIGNQAAEPSARPDAAWDDLTPDQQAGMSRGYWEHDLTREARIALVDPVCSRQ